MRLTPALTGIVVSCCLWLLTAGSSYASPFLDAVDGCIDEILASEDTIAINEGIDVWQLCPDVESTYKEDLYAGSFSNKIEQASSLNELLDIQSLLTDAHLKKAGYIALDAVLLKDILREVVQSNREKKLSWWGEFKSWLRSLSKDKSKVNDGWLIDFLNALVVPEWLGEIIYYVSVATILIMALGVIVYEFRQTRRKKRASIKTAAVLFSSGQYPGNHNAVVPLEEIPRLPLVKQPPAILGLVIHSLITKGKLPDNLSFTNNEFLHYIKEKNSWLAARFSHISNCVEAAVYGGSVIDQAELTGIYDVANEILTNEDNGRSHER